MKDKYVFHIDVNNAFLSWTAVYLLEHGYKKDIRKDIRTCLIYKLTNNKTADFEKTPLFTSENTKNSKSYVKYLVYP